ncbi:MAG TPA: hypothetical protein VFJ58_04770 [Armatimonadota bacterium]|nr:hypothetical protein [Armatimonadota bacterium]
MLHSSFYGINARRPSPLDIPRKRDPEHAKSLAALGLFIPSLRGVHRPVYITTDDAGIGVTQWRGSRSIRWDDIGACAVTPLRIDLHTFSGQRIPVHLVGHTDRACGALAALIIDRAGLDSDLQQWRTGVHDTPVRCYSRSEWRLVPNGRWPLTERLSFYEWSDSGGQPTLQGQGGSRDSQSLIAPSPHRASLSRTLSKRGRGS